MAGGRRTPVDPIDLMRRAQQSLGFALRDGGYRRRQHIEDATHLIGSAMLRMQEMEEEALAVDVADPANACDLITGTGGGCANSWHDSLAMRDPRCPACGEVDPEIP